MIWSFLPIPLTQSISKPHTQCLLVGAKMCSYREALLFTIALTCCFEVLIDVRWLVNPFSMQRYCCGAACVCLPAFLCRAKCIAIKLVGRHGSLTGWHHGIFAILVGQTCIQYSASLWMKDDLVWVFKLKCKHVLVSLWCLFDVCCCSIIIVLLVCMGLPMMLSSTSWLQLIHHHQFKPRWSVKM